MYDQVQSRINELNDNEAFLVTVTYFTDKQKGEMNTFVYSNKFPHQAFDGTKEMIGNLIEEQKNKQSKENGE